MLAEAKDLAGTSGDLAGTRPEVDSKQRQRPIAAETEAETGGNDHKEQGRRGRTTTVARTGTGQQLNRGELAVVSQEP
jgi:hypothetical protein